MAVTIKVGSLKAVTMVATLKLNVEITRVFIWRIRLAKWLISLAAQVLECDLEFKTDGEDGD